MYFSVNTCPKSLIKFVLTKCGWSIIHIEGTYVAAILGIPALLREKATSMLLLAVESVSTWWMFKTIKRPIYTEPEHTNKTPVGLFLENFIFDGNLSFMIIKIKKHSKCLIPSKIVSCRSASSR